MKLKEKDLEILCNTASEAAIAAGKYIQSQFDHHYDKGIKEGASSLAAQVVTEVDIKAQEIILEHLQDSIKQYDLGLLTEEATDDKSRLEKGYFWCIDPMDGTLPFTEGRTGYSVAIALITASGKPVIGVVYIPDLKLCHTAIKGGRVLVNKKPFILHEKQTDTFSVFMDTSLKSQSYFESLTNQLNDWASKQNYHIQYKDGYGAVRNAVEVMQSGIGCYFKLAKKQQGGGSIWDFAATCLFFEELGLYVSDTFGKPLHLNNPDTAFMNRSGVLYTTNDKLSHFLVTIGKQVIRTEQI